MAGVICVRFMSRMVCGHRHATRHFVFMHFMPRHFVVHGHVMVHLHIMVMHLMVMHLMPMHLMPMHFMARRHVVMHGFLVRIFCMGHLFFLVHLVPSSFTYFRTLGAALTLSNFR